MLLYVITDGFTTIFDYCLKYCFNMSNISTLLIGIKKQFQCPFEHSLLLCTVFLYLNLWRCFKSEARLQKFLSRIGIPTKQDSEIHLGITGLETISCMHLHIKEVTNYVWTWYTKLVPRTTPTTTTFTSATRSTNIDFLLVLIEGQLVSVTEDFSWNYHSPLLYSIKSD